MAGDAARSKRRHLPPCVVCPLPRPASSSSTSVPAASLRRPDALGNENDATRPVTGFARRPPPDASRRPPRTPFADDEDGDDINGEASRSPPRHRRAHRRSPPVPRPRRSHLHRHHRRLDSPNRHARVERPADVAGDAVVAGVIVPPGAFGFATSSRAVSRRRRRARGVGALGTEVVG